MLNLSKINKYLLLVWIIILSGVWSISVPPLLAIVLNFTLSVYMLIKLCNIKEKRGTPIIILFVILLFFTFFLNCDFLSWMSYAFIICFCIMGLYISAFWKEGEFLDKYTNIMTIIVVISLIMYCFRSFLATHQTGFPIIQGQAVSYTNYFVYLYCRELPDRNCAIFWEPGAFAVFVGIALFYILATNKKNKLLRIFLFIIALLTTQSTLAYTIILFAILMSLTMHTDKGGFLQKMVIGILPTFIVLIIMNEFGIFQNIQEKLFSGIQTNASSRARNVAQMIDLFIATKSPVVGVGFNGYFEQVHSIGTLFGQKWTMAANTFTFMAAIFGIPYVLISVNGIIKIYPKNTNVMFKIVSSCFWIWLFVTQNFVQKPIFYCLIFLGYMASAFEKGG